MRSGFAARKNSTVAGLNGNGLEPRLTLLYVLGNASNGAACAYAGNKNVYLAICIFPDLRARSGVVDGRIGRIVKLPHDEAIRRLGQNPICLSDGALHAV